MNAVEYMGVKTAAHHTVHGFPGGAMALASAIGISSGVLSNQVSLTRPQDNLSLVSAMRVMRATENYSILNAMAQELGHVVMQVGVAHLDQPHAQMMARLFKEVGEAVSALAQSLADGKVSRNEMMNIHTEVDQSIVMLIEAKQMAQRLYDEGAR
ncbi:phage regulatory CII family protein [Parvibium lacunae]|uniref:Uncharacterized protein n=1 Tax=Parvibium lacunae TaxID=1888893 RepID=A0A368L851_9BURK|nr:phage regulatory CII family protein [Parvibium lacunae]RCS59732.1 hypothetical protein DU000_03215 [Parvibium lacunae]